MGLVRLVSGIGEGAGGGRNPLLPLEHHIPDPEARVMPNGRLYVYGSYDTSEHVYCSDQYRVASTVDLRNWTIHDVAFRASQATWADCRPSVGRSFLDGATCYADIPAYARDALPPETFETPFEEFAARVRRANAERQPRSTLLYAPDAIERDGRYYLYMCLSDDSEGVAVGDRPEGPFGHPVELPVTGIDPAVLLDSDGQGYYYWGQFSASGARLNPDMVSLDEQSVVRDLLTVTDHDFHEGASVRRRGEMYYLVFAETSRGRPTCLGYATSSSPLGPFTYRGVIIDNAECDPASWNNHGSIAEFRGRWYVFYHRSTRGVASMRRLCVEPIEFREDGTIPEVPMTSQGAGDPFVPGEWIPAFAACGVHGNVRIAPQGGSEALVEIEPGDHAVFRYVASSAGLREVEVAAEGHGEIEVHVGGVRRTTVAPGSGTAPIAVPAGRHEVRLLFRTADDLSVQGLRFG